MVSLGFNGLKDIHGCITTEVKLPLLKLLFRNWVLFIHWSVSQFATNINTCSITHMIFQNHLPPFNTLRRRQKRQPLRRRYFQIHFLEWKLLDLKQYFIEMCHLWSNWQYVTVGTDSGLAPNMRQAKYWTNDGLVYWHIYASLSLSELNITMNDQRSIAKGSFQ